VPGSLGLDGTVECIKTQTNSSISSLFASLFSGQDYVHDLAFRRLFINILVLESLNLLTRSMMFSREFCLDCDSDVTSPPIAAAVAEDRDWDLFK